MKVMSVPINYYYYYYGYYYIILSNPETNNKWKWEREGLYK